MDDPFGASLEFNNEEVFNGIRDGDLNDAVDSNSENDLALLESERRPQER